MCHMIRMCSARTRWWAARGASPTLLRLRTMLLQVLYHYMREYYMRVNRALVREYRALLSEDFSKREILFGKYLGILSATHAHQICDMTYIHQNIL